MKSFFEKRKDSPKQSFLLSMTSIWFIILPILFNPLGLKGNTPGRDQKLMEADIRATIAKVAELITANYVFPDKGKHIADYINEQEKNGKYAGLKNPMDLADAVTADFHRFSGDRHLALEAVRPAFQPDSANVKSAPRKAQSPERDPGFGRYYNYGFRKFEILTGNVGYLDLRGFNNIRYPAAKLAAESFMSLFANVRAAIIDVRLNPGGAGSMADLLASYFFDTNSIHLLSNTSRFEGKEETSESWTLKEVQGKRYPDLPLYLLISNRTGSAAEHFVFGLKGQKRAVLVGETTVGAGHNVSFFPVNKYFRCVVAIGRTYNPKTGVGWEGTGIQPHIQVSSENALERAHYEALKGLADKAETGWEKTELDWLIPIVEAQYNPVDVNPALLKLYSGKYGVRSYHARQGGLYYSREGRKRIIKMFPIADDRFIIPGLDTTIYHFIKGSDEKVHELRICNQNGSIQKIPKE